MTLHSTFEGAVGGVRVNHPKPQRLTKKHQPQDQPRPVLQSQQEINHPRQDNYLQGPHNTTMYMNLPNTIQNKICGRCGLTGHIKRMCKEEVHCRYCKVYTHSTAACRTYPVTSSRKNTPEKRTSEDIECEVSRRVQEEMRRILNNFSTSRQIANTQEVSQRNLSLGTKDDMSQIHNIPRIGQQAQNLIGDYQHPPEVFQGDTRSLNKVAGSGDQILNQQWDKPPHMQPPMIPLTASTSQQTQYTATNAMSRNIETSARGPQDNLTSQRPWDTTPVKREKASTFTTHRQIETPLSEQRENRLIRGVTDQPFSGQESASTPTRH